MKSFSLICAAAVLLFSALPGGAAYNPAITPEPLAPWVEWLQAERPETACLLSHQGNYQCVWPSELSLRVDDTAGHFSFQVELYQDAIVALPGDDKHWPQNVTEQNGTPLTVFRHNGHPAVSLSPGQYTIRGDFNWTGLPRLLGLPPQTGLIHLTRRQEAIAHVQVNGDTLLLQEENPAGPGNQNDTLNIRVHRLLEDGIPLQLTSRIQLDVSGSSREIQLQHVLPEHFQAKAVYSDLATRINANNTLSVLLKPGRWQINIHAYSLNSQPVLYSNNQEPLWPAQEVWSFAADAQYRNISITGAPAVDPAQSQVPPEWQNHPAFLINADASASLNEISRISGDRKNKLALHKKLWLDFNGQGFTVEDSLSGELGPNARLNADRHYQLGSASTELMPLVVSNLDGRLGVEVRQSSVNLSALGRMQRQSVIPVSGWEENFETVTSEIILPPGWSILASAGADQVTGVWLDQFNLWDIFLILIIAVAIKRVAGWRTALLALAVITLTYQRQGAPLIIWLNFAICIALAQHIRQKWQQGLGYYSLASFAVFIVIMLPFATQQARMVFYPQLEHAQIHSGMDYAQQARALAPQADMDNAILQKEEVTDMASSMVRLSAPQPEKKAPSLHYDEQQQIQAGPPRMNWRWNSAHLSWSGPVTPDQTVRLVMASPWLDKLGHLLALFSPLLLAWLLWRKSPRPRLPQLPKSGVAAALLFIVSGVWLPAPQASVLIDKELLDELRDRLFEPAPCHPDCAAINAVKVSAKDHSVSLELDLSAQEATSLAIPSVKYDWPGQVTLNDKAATLKRTKDQLLVALPQGHHRLVISGQLSARQTLDLSFSQVIHNLSARLDGWQLNKQQTPGQHIQLEPILDTSHQQLELQPDDIPPLVKVERHLVLQHDWMVHTRVYRIAPGQGGINTLIPLLAGEQPLTETALVDGAMPVQLAPNQHSYEWRSTLTASSEIPLIAPSANEPRYETWRLTADPRWHIDAESNATKLIQGDQVQWLPRPGDQLLLTVSRPTPIAGETLAVNALNLEQSLGTGMQTTVLDLNLQTFQAGKFELQLPENAELSRLHINGAEQPNPQRSGRLSIPVSASTDSLSLEWQEPSELAVLTQPAQVQLNYPYANAQVTVKLPNDRWVLWLAGPQIGPAVLLWSIAAIVLLLAIGVAKTGLAPLRTWEWLLLSLGIVTMNAFLLLVIAACFMALTLRGRTTADKLGKHFTAIQIALILFSLLSVVLLLVSIPVGLLAQPQMLVQGNGSSAYLLNWFTDQGTGATPQVTILSLPLWCYRLVMLLWSLWLAFALTGWLRWGWTQLSRGGFWLSTPVKKPAESDSLELDLPEDK